MNIEPLSNGNSLIPYQSRLKLNILQYNVPYMIEVEYVAHSEGNRVISKLSSMSVATKVNDHPFYFAANHGGYCPTIMVFNNKHGVVDDLGSAVEVIQQCFGPNHRGANEGHRFIVVENNFEGDSELIILLLQKYCDFVFWLVSLAYETGYHDNYVTIYFIGISISKDLDHFQGIPQIAPLTGKNKIISYFVPGKYFISEVCIV